MSRDDADARFANRMHQLAAVLSPTRPIREFQNLRGRARELQTVEEELTYFSSIPFIYGPRGVGKTSLALTAATTVSADDREPVYVAVSASSTVLILIREIAQSPLTTAMKCGGATSVTQKVELNVGWSPYIKVSRENRAAVIEMPRDLNEAVRTLRDVAEILPNAKRTVVIVDELEELPKGERKSLAHLIKEIGDQEIAVKFILVGIADDVHELIDAHQSVPRYLKEVELSPLPAQDLMEIVASAGRHVGVDVPSATLARIAIVGDGYPHFSHLIGKALLVEVIRDDSDRTTEIRYKRAIDAAVRDSLQELRASYEAAVQRADDIYKRVLWAVADFDTIDLRTSEIDERLSELTRRMSWDASPRKLTVAKVLARLRLKTHGGILKNTPARYGGFERRNRHHRLAHSLMKGHIRLRAESEAHVLLGRSVSL